MERCLIAWLSPEPGLNSGKLFWWASFSTGVWEELTSIWASFFHGSSRERYGNSYMYGNCNKEYLLVSNLTMGFIYTCTCSYPMHDLILASNCSVSTGYVSMVSTISSKHDLEMNLHIVNGWKVIGRKTWDRFWLQHWRGCLFME